MKTALLCLMSVQPETPVVTAKLYSNYKFFEQLIYKSVIEHAV